MRFEQKPMKGYKISSTASLWEFNHHCPPNSCLSASRKWWQRRPQMSCPLFAAKTPVVPINTNCVPRPESCASLQVAKLANPIIFHFEEEQSLELDVSDGRHSAILLSLVKKHISCWKVVTKCVAIIDGSY